MMEGAQRTSSSKCKRDRNLATVTRNAGQHRDIHRGAHIQHEALVGQHETLGENESLMIEKYERQREVSQRLLQRARVDSYPQ